MEATIDRDGCISCGICVETCPEVFYFADDGKAEAKNPIPSEAESDAIEAKESCPVSVIEISES